MSSITAARPIQAALASASAFTLGGILPVLLIIFIPVEHLIVIVSAGSLLFLALLGAVSAKVGGANIFVGVARVTFWGALAMAITAAVGNLFGAH